MKRASYREAIDFIAQMDSAGNDDAHDPQVVSELITCLLVAEIFQVDPHKVGTDVVRARRRSDG